MGDPGLYTLICSVEAICSNAVHPGLLSPFCRLFPDDGEGGNGAEPSDKPPAPVHPFHPKMTIRRGVLATECADVMQKFFQLRRKKKVKEEEDDPPPPPSCLPISNHPSKVLTKVQDIFHMTFCL